MSKPTNLPEWDTTQVNSIAPDATHKSEGWLAPGGVPEKPPFQTFNYWQNEVYRWIQYYDSLNIRHIFDTFALFDASTLVEVGDNIETLSYINDAGAALYTVVAAATGTEAQGYFDLSGTSLQAELIRPAKVNPRVWGADGTGATDSTTALIDSYTYAKTGTIINRLPYHIQHGQYKFSSQLNWDGDIKVTADGPEKSVLMKDGNFVGILIDGDNAHYEGFSLDSLGGTDVSAGIQIENGNLTNFDRIIVQNQGAEGILLYSATNSIWTNVTCAFNGSHGFVLDAASGAAAIPFVNANDFEGIRCLRNEGHGFWIKNGDNNNNTGRQITCEQNLYNGFFCEATANNFKVYTEVNSRTDSDPGTGAGTYFDVNLSSASIRNNIDVLAATSDSAIYWEGTGNTGINIGTSVNGNLNIGQIVLRKREVSGAGKDLTIGAGAAGAVGAAQKGGNLTIFSGDADGTGNKGSGYIDVSTGTTIGTGEDPGSLRLQKNGGIVIVGGITAGSAQASIDCVDPGRAVIPNHGTTTERDAGITSPVDFMVYGNETQGTLQVYLSGAWYNINVTVEP